MEDYQNSGDNSYSNSWKKGKKLTATLIDQSGEIIAGQLSVRLPAQPKLYDWVHCFTRGLSKLANLSLNGAEASLVFFILSQVDWDNQFVPDSSLIWAVTGIHPKHQSRILKALVKKGVIIFQRKIGNTSVYLVSPLLGWKGSARRYPVGADLRLWDNQFDWSALEDRRRPVTVCELCGDTSKEIAGGVISGGKNTQCCADCLKVCVED